MSEYYLLLHQMDIKYNSCNITSYSSCWGRLAAHSATVRTAAGPVAALDTAARWRCFRVPDRELDLGRAALESYS